MASNTDIDTELLITLVEAKPVLWDKTLAIYKDKIATKNAWRDVCITLQPIFDDFSDAEKNIFGKEVMKRWGNVRDAYTRSRKKQKEVTKSGAGASHIKKYIFNDQLQFLHKVSEQRETEDSLTSNMGEEEQEIQPSTFRKPDKSTQSSRKRKLDPVEEKMMKALEQSENRHLSFFKGIIPAVETFNEDDILQLQMGVLQLISDIKRQKTDKAVHQRRTQAAYSLPMQPTHQARSQVPYSTPMQLETDQLSPPLTYSSLTPVHTGAAKEYYNNIYSFSSTASPLPSPALSLSSNYTEESADSVDFAS